MKNRKIEQIRAMTRDKDAPPLTPAEKQWLKENVSDVFKSEKGYPVVLCRYFEPDYKQKLAMVEQIGKKMPLHVINLKNDSDL